MVANPLRAEKSCTNSRIAINWKLPTHSHSVRESKNTHLKVGSNKNTIFMLPENPKNIEEELSVTKIIKPQWKRKYKILIKASFIKQDDRVEKQIEEILSQTMGGMWVFDNSIK